MLIPYSKPVDGYLSMFPLRNLGDTLKSALMWTRTSRFHGAAAGFALYIPALGSRGCVRLKSRTITGARKEAVRVSAKHGGVILCVAAAMSADSKVIYRKVEMVFVESREVVRREKGLSIVAPNGVIVAKDARLNNSRDIGRMAERLAGQLRSADREFIKPYLEKVLQRFDADYENMSSSQFSKMFRDTRRIMNNLRMEDIMPIWSQHIDKTVQGVASDSRKIVHDFMTPRVGLSLSVQDRKALEKISTMPSLFLRDEYGRRSDSLTKKGREIIRDGLKKGYGRATIGKELQTQLPGLWRNHSKAYASVVAANAVTKARAWSDVSGYFEAGIEYLEVQAILDERTTDICRALDGTIVKVDVVYNSMERSLGARTPEESIKQSPFLQEATDKKTGQKYIRTATGNRVADVVRSGQGRIDDRGIYRFSRLGKDLTNVNIGVPPYHHNCRSTTVPRTETIQVPKGMVPRAMPILPRMRPEAPKKSDVNVRHLDYGRPVTFVEATRVTQGKTTTAGQNDPVVVAEQLGYPDAFSNVEPSIPYRRALKKPEIDMVAAKWKLERGLQQLESDAKWRELGRSKDAEFPIESALRKLYVGGRDLAVSLRVKSITPEHVRSVVLHEYGKSASRLYKLRSLDSESVTNLRFDDTKRKMAINTIAALRKAARQEEISKLLKKLEDVGFLKRTRTPVK